MNSRDFFWGIGDFFETILAVYDENVGFTTVFNTIVILGGFFGMFYWLRHQLKFNKDAKNNPNQIK